MMLMQGLLVATVLVTTVAGSALAEPPQVGQPADIAPTAYQYRVDRPATQNPPESWVLPMQYAGLPYDQKVDTRGPAIKPILCGLLWEEVRPLRRLELTWPRGARKRPAAEALKVECLDATDDTAHTWWNPRSLKDLGTPTVSADGLTYTYTVPVDTWGVVVSLRDGAAAGYAVPTVRALGDDVWKKMDVEVEWGYEPQRAALAYDGRAEAYDGVIANLEPLRSDAGTELTDETAWRSAAADTRRRGVRFSLLYIGSCTWRRIWPYAAQQQDVARTIVTIWTKSGNFSFLAADLEHGPILAPEYGFFVRATGLKQAAAAPSEPQGGMRGDLLTTRMPEIPGVPLMRGWANNLIPWFGVNPTDQPGSAGSLTIPARAAAMHPLTDRDVAAGWRSPIAGTVSVSGRVAMADALGGNGVDWSVISDSAARRQVLAGGQLRTGEAHDIAAIGPLAAVTVQPGDMLSLVLGPRDRNYMCDTTVIALSIREAAGERREWSLQRDVMDSIADGNPHADAAGRPKVWWFYSPPAEPELSQPPYEQASRATNARAFIKELAARNLTTIRQRTRTHEEQTWERAVEAMRGTDLPPIPAPELLPAMEIDVPSARLNAQWKLGSWHILRRSIQDPQGRWHFNDYPFGILASETYLILHALDLQGMHKEAADGLDQWLSLPLKHAIVPGEGGQHPWSRPDRPLGHFSDGDGCLTLAEGPEGAGGNMDGVHAMGPGAIMFALTEHHRLTGDKEWLRAAAPRLLANAEWILRQRRLLSKVVPGGKRMWSAGLQPAHVVTPDSMCMYQQYYESEAYYWLGVRRLAEVMQDAGMAAAIRLESEAEAYRKELLASVERSIALTPVTAVRDGTYHSFIPFAPYVRGFASGAWGWRRCQGHVGALYWDTVQSADPLISPAGLLPPDDVRVQGHLDVLEDRLLLENGHVYDRTPDYDPERDWFSAASWQYQCGLERHANIHLLADDIPEFLRTWLNQYAVDIMPGEYTFREHTVGGPPDKLFEESAFLERFRMALVMEQGDELWLSRATPREWLAQGKRIAVRNAPSAFGDVAYEITSDSDHGSITATVTMPNRIPQRGVVVLRLRHPQALPMKAVLVNGKPWPDFDPTKECVKLTGLKSEAHIEAKY